MINRKIIFASLVSVLYACGAPSGEPISNETSGIGGGDSIKYTVTSSSNSGASVGGSNNTSNNTSTTVVSSTGIDIQNDPFNCGEMGHWCQPPINMKPSCKEGKCAFDCLIEYADCDNNLSNGCEINIGNNINNCGSCYSKCLLNHSVFSCQEGSCVFDKCENNFADCYQGAGTFFEGCETNLNIGHPVMLDTYDCGACGKNCIVPEKCLNGVCGAF